MTIRAPKIAKFQRAVRLQDSGLNRVAQTKTGKGLYSAPTIKAQFSESEVLRAESRYLKSKGFK